MNLKGDKAVTMNRKRKEKRVMRTGNSIGKEVCRMINDLLKRNRSLTEVNLGSEEKTKQKRRKEEKNDKQIIVLEQKELK